MEHSISPRCLGHFVLSGVGQVAPTIRPLLPLDCKPISGRNCMHHLRRSQMDAHELAQRQPTRQSRLPCGHICSRIHYLAFDAQRATVKKKEKEKYNISHKQKSQKETKKCRHVLLFLSSVHEVSRAGHGLAVPVIPSCPSFIAISAQPAVSPVERRGFTESDALGSVTTVARGTLGFNPTVIDAAPLWRATKCCTRMRIRSTLRSNTPN